MEISIQHHQNLADMVNAPTGQYGRAEYLRSIPLSQEERDLLTGLASEMPVQLSFPPLHEIVAVFGCQEKVSLDILGPLSICSTSVSQLAMTLLSMDLNAHRTDQIKTGMQIYLTELQRLSGALFPLEHAFWSVFYQSTAPMRLTDWTSTRLDRVSTTGIVLGIARSKLRVFLLPLDVVFLRSDKTNQLSYEMLRQSLTSVLGAHLLYAVQADTLAVRSQLSHAARLSARLNLHACDEWQSVVSRQLHENNLL